MIDDDKFFHALEKYCNDEISKRKFFIKSNPNKFAIFFSNERLLNDFLVYGKSFFKIRTLKDFVYLKFIKDDDFNECLLFINKEIEDQELFKQFVFKFGTKLSFNFFLSNIDNYFHLFATRELSVIDYIKYGIGETFFRYCIKNDIDFDFSVFSAINKLPVVYSLDEQEISEHIVSFVKNIKHIDINRRYRFSFLHDCFNAFEICEIEPPLKTGEYKIFQYLAAKKLLEHGYKIVNPEFIQKIQNNLEHYELPADLFETEQKYEVKPIKSNSVSLLNFVEQINNGNKDKFFIQDNMENLLFAVDKGLLNVEVLKDIFVNKDISFKFSHQNSLFKNTLSELFFRYPNLGLQKILGEWIVSPNFYSNQDSIADRAKLLLERKDEITLSIVSDFDGEISSALGLVNDRINYQTVVHGKEEKITIAHMLNNIYMSGISIVNKRFFEEKKLDKNELLKSGVISKEFYENVLSPEEKVSPNKRMRII